MQGSKITETKESVLRSHNLKGKIMEPLVVVFLMVQAPYTAVTHGTAGFNCRGQTEHWTVLGREAYTLCVSLMIVTPFENILNINLPIS